MSDAKQTTRPMAFTPYRKRILARQMLLPTRVETAVGKQIAAAGDYVCIDGQTVWIERKGAFESSYERDIDQPQEPALYELRRLSDDDRS